MRRLAFLAAAGLAAALLPPGAGAQTNLDLVSRTTLRVCADPHNLPFSNDKREGFENKIADLVGQALHESVAYTWYPESTGFVRNTLLAGSCDVVMGTVAGGDMMDTTNPYYHSGYMVVTRTADHITATSLDDPVFVDKRIGLIAGTPPTELVLRNDLMEHVTPYDLHVDTRNSAPSLDMLHDLVSGKIDVGLLWGPYAGYYIKHDHLPLAAAFLKEEPGAPRLDYRIAMGVRPNETNWRRTLNGVIRKDQDAITKILIEYGIPLLDEQNHPIAESLPR